MSIYSLFTHCSHKKWLIVEYAWLMPLMASYVFYYYFIHYCNLEIGINIHFSISCSVFLYNNFLFLF